MENYYFEIESDYVLTDSIIGAEAFPTKHNLIIGDVIDLSEHKWNEGNKKIVFSDYETVFFKIESRMTDGNRILLKISPVNINILKKEKFEFWIPEFKSLNSKSNEDDAFEYWWGERKLTELLSSLVNVAELKHNDIIVINFDTKKLGYERNLQEDTSSYKFRLDHIRYSLEIDNNATNEVIVDKWFYLEPLLDWEK